MSVKWHTNKAQQVYDEILTEARKAQDDILSGLKSQILSDFDEDIKTKIAAHTVFIDSLAIACTTAAEVDASLILAMKE